MNGWFRRLFRRSRTGPMDCHQVGALLQHYLDGEIDEHRATLIADHLEDCRRCGLERDAYERIKMVLATRRTDVPADALARLHSFGTDLVRQGGDSGR